MKFAHKFFLTLQDRQILKSREFNIANRAEHLSLLRLGLALMGLFSLFAFIAVLTAENYEETRAIGRNTQQLIRLGLFFLVALFIYWTLKYEAFALENFARASLVVWLSLSLVLTALLLTQFILTSRGEFAQPHNRYNSALLIVTMVVYMLGSIGSTTVFLILLPPSLVTFTFNFKFLSALDGRAFSTYFVVAHIVGVTFCQFKFKRDVELFVKDRALNLALKSVHESEAREKENSAAKTRLIASVSHDLRQPLNSLGLYNNLLKSKFGGDQNTALNSIAERVQECVSAMEGNLTRLQDIALLQSRTHTVDLMPISLRESLRTIETVFQPIAEASKVRLKVCIDAKNDSLLHSQSERLFEILANLLSNAIKFSNTHGQHPPWVLVRARKRIQKGGVPFVQITVRDNGIGISPEHHERIFHEYVQLNNPERQSAKGYGLGLSVVRELTNSLLDHHLRLNSRIGNGASFKLSIPLASEDQIKFASSNTDQVPNIRGNPIAVFDVSKQSAKTLAGAQIILIEDDETLRTALTTQLLELGAHVRSYPAAKHALAATANDISSPTCIISDYWLPASFDGLQTIEKLREQFDNNVPALLISAASDIDPKRLEGIPNLEFALKPVSALTLFGFVEKHIDASANH